MNLREVALEYSKDYGVPNNKYVANVLCSYSGLKEENGDLIFEVIDGNKTPSKKFNWTLERYDLSHLTFDEVISIYKSPLTFNRRLTIELVLSKVKERYGHNLEHEDIGDIYIEDKNLHVVISEHSLFYKGKFFLNLKG